MFRFKLIMKHIESLLPHRHPFLFVDRLISASDEEIIGVKLFDNEHTLLRGSVPEFEFVPGAILIEAMAQCGGAGLRQLNISNGLYALASIDTANFFTLIPYQQEVKFLIKNLQVSSRIIKQSGIAYLKDVPALEASWTCVRIQK